MNFTQKTYISHFPRNMAVFKKIYRNTDIYSRFRFNHVFSFREIISPFIFLKVQSTCNHLELNLILKTAVLQQVHLHIEYDGFPPTCPTPMSSIISAWPLFIPINNKSNYIFYQDSVCNSSFSFLFVIFLQWIFSLYMYIGKIKKKLSFTCIGWKLCHYPLSGMTYIVCSEFYQIMSSG